MGGSMRGRVMDLGTDDSMVLRKDFCSCSGLHEQNHAEFRGIPNRNRGAAGRPAQKHLPFRYLRSFFGMAS